MKDTDRNEFPPISHFENTFRTSRIGSSSGKPFFSLEEGKLARPKIPLVLFRRNHRVFAVFEDTIVRFVAENTDVQRRWRVGQNLDAESGLIGGCSRDTNPGARTGIDLDVLSPLSPSSSAGCSPCVLIPLPAASTADSSPGLLPSTNPFFSLSLLLTK